MQARFLCPNHRQWLNDTPQAAQTHLADTMETGLYYRSQQQWTLAIPYLGCAFETADIVLQQQASRQALLDFTCSAIMLANTMQQRQLGENICQQAHSRLLHSPPLSDQHAQRCLQQCLLALSSYQQNTQEIKAWEH